MAPTWFLVPYFYWFALLLLLLLLLLLSLSPSILLEIRHHYERHRAPGVNRPYRAGGGNGLVMQGEESLVSLVKRAVKDSMRASRSMSGSDQPSAGARENREGQEEGEGEGEEEETELVDSLDEGIRAVTRELQGTLGGLARPHDDMVAADVEEELPEASQDSAVVVPGGLDDNHLNRGGSFEGGTDENATSVVKAGVVEGGGGTVNREPPRQGAGSAVGSQVRDECMPGHLPQTPEHTPSGRVISTPAQTQAQGSDLLPIGEEVPAPSRTVLVTQIPAVHGVGDGHGVQGDWPQPPLPLWALEQTQSQGEAIRLQISQPGSEEAQPAEEGGESQGVPGERGSWPSVWHQAQSPLFEDCGVGVE
ncbi:unnamed protein product, partial [Discosporangium mesarthrocarpum]